MKGNYHAKTHGSQNRLRVPPKRVPPVFIAVFSNNIAEVPFLGVPFACSMMIHDHTRPTLAKLMFSGVCVLFRGSPCFLCHYGSQYILCCYNNFSYKSYHLLSWPILTIHLTTVALSGVLHTIIWSRIFFFLFIIFSDFLFFGTGC